MAETRPIAAESPPSVWSNLFWPWLLLAGIPLVQFGAYEQVAAIVVMTAGLIAAPWLAPRIGRKCAQMRTAIAAIGFVLAAVRLGLYENSAPIIAPVISSSSLFLLAISAPTSSRGIGKQTALLSFSSFAFVLGSWLVLSSIALPITYPDLALSPVTHVVLGALVFAVLSARAGSKEARPNFRSIIESCVFALALGCVISGLPAINATLTIRLGYLLITVALTIATGEALGVFSRTPDGQRPQGYENLSQREAHAIELAVQGLSSEQIAAEMDIAASTARTLLSRAYAKLGTERRHVLPKATSQANTTASLTMLPASIPLFVAGLLLCYALFFNNPLTAAALAPAWMVLLWVALAKEQVSVRAAAVIFVLSCVTLGLLEGPLVASSLLILLARKNEATHSGQRALYQELKYLVYGTIACLLIFYRLDASSLVALVVALLCVAAVLIRPRQTADLATQQPLDILIDLGLTQRQAEVLLRVSQGCSGKEIAADLHIASGTVNSARYAGYKKLGVHSKQELSKLISSFESQGV